MKPLNKRISIFNMQYEECLEGFSSHHAKKRKSKLKKIRSKLTRTVLKRNLNE